MGKFPSEKSVFCPYFADILCMVTKRGAGIANLARLVKRGAIDGGAIDRGAIDRGRGPNMRSTVESQLSPTFDEFRWSFR